MAKLDLGEMSFGKTILLLVCIVVFVSTAGVIFDRLLIKEGASRLDMMVVSNTLTGCVAGGLVLQIIRRERERRAIVRERLQIISEMNHHVRNALQVLSYFVHKEQDEKDVEMLRDSVDRIQWALKEVLPGGLDMPMQTDPPSHRHIH